MTSIDLPAARSHRGDHEQDGGLRGASRSVRHDGFNGGDRHRDRDIPGLLIVPHQDGGGLRLPPSGPVVPRTRRCTGTAASSSQRHGSSAGPIGAPGVALGSDLRRGDMCRTSQL
jgi:hypothetical protein